MSDDPCRSQLKPRNEGEKLKVMKAVIKKRQNKIEFQARRAQKVRVL